MRALSTRDMLSLVSDIYDAAVEPQRWQHTLDRITEAASARYAVIGLAEPDAGRAVRLAASQRGIDQIEPLSEAERLSVPGNREAIAGDIDIPHSVLTTVTEAEARSLPAYSWALRNGVRDACTVKFAHTGPLIGIVSLSTGFERDVVGPAEMEFLKLLSPHFRRAALIGNILCQQRVALGSYRSALDVLTTPALLVDADARLQYANPAAEAELSLATHISATHGVVAASLAVAQAALADAIKRAATESGAALEGRGIGVPLSSGSDTAAVAYVLPIGMTEARPALGRAGAAIFLATSVRHNAPTTTILMTLFNLTPSEARVMLAAGRGQSIAAIADALGVSEPTVKTHLARVYTKTGRSRLGEVSGLVTAIAPI